MGKITINELEIDVIRAWKDEEYRNSLSEEQRSQLPENPAGVIDLSDEATRTVAGGVSVDIVLWPGVCYSDLFGTYYCDRFFNWSFN